MTWFFKKKVVLSEKILPHMVLLKLSKGSIMDYANYCLKLNTSSFKYVMLWVLSKITFLDSKKRKHYIKNHESPSLSTFVSANTDSMALWSTEVNANTPSALFGIWFERSKQIYGKTRQGSTNVANPRVNILICNSISDKS